MSLAPSSATSSGSTPQIAVSKDTVFDKILYRLDSVVPKFNEACDRNPQVASKALQAYGLGHKLVVVNDQGLNEKQLIARFQSDVIPPILEFIRQEDLARKTGLSEDELVVAFFINEFEIREAVSWDKTIYRNDFERILTGALILDIQPTALLPSKSTN